MTQRIGVKRFATIAAAIVTIFCGSICSAQLIRAPLTDGFARTSSIDMSVDEMLGSAKRRTPNEPILGPGYPSLWIAEIQYKPVRLIRMPVTDPGTGRVSDELVWYLVYRIIPRDYTELAGEGQQELMRKLEDPDRNPANEVDPVRARPLIMPRFTLKIEDVAGDRQELIDEVNLEIQKAVFLREMGKRGLNLKLHNSVEAISEVSAPVSINDPDPLSKAVYGVAVWRNVDPRTDYFTVSMSGLTNAYRITSEDEASRVVEQKVVVQRFARPGDEFLQEEREFRMVDDADLDGDGRADVTYPHWEYRPRNVQISVPEIDSVLRKAGKEPLAIPE